MSYDATRLAEVMTAIKTAVITHFGDVEITLPERQYTTIGQPAVDVDQLVVYLERGFAGTPGAERQDPLLCVQQKTAAVAVELLRCVSVVDDSGVAPSQEELQADGDMLVADAWALWRAGEIMAAPGGAGYAKSVPTVEALEPAGGYAGSKLTVQVEL